MKVTDPSSGVTQFSYDANGNLLGVTDARGSVIGYTYDAMDRLIDRADPLLRAESYQYNANGNLTSFTDRKGEVTGRTYDLLNRLIQVTYADSSTMTYTWGTGHRVTEIVDSVAGAITRTYDGLDRLMQEVTPNGTVTYTYDAAGRRVSMAVSGQATITYGYDNADRLTSITQGSAVVTFEYDDANRRTRLTLPNGVKTEYAYDAASRLTGLTYKLGATTLGNLTYTYDAASQRTKVGGTWARTLIPDAVASATYDAANQQTAFGGQAQTYDLNGNLTGDGTNTWNARNQLASISGPTPASFVYDPMGRRQRKTINGTNTDFVYDGLNVVKEAVGATTVNLLTGLGIDEFLARTTGGTTEYLLSEALGSTVALVDGSGAVATESSYEPFGIATVGGTTSSNEFGYTGREDDGTGLNYYRARYYHPGLQRFISEDPLEFAGGEVNLYSYVGNSPTNRMDPLGLDYLDVNVSGGYVFGATGGLIVQGSCMRLYLGGGVVSPGVGASVTWSPSVATTGWNAAVQVQAGPAVQIGRGLGSDGQPGELFVEVGGGMPPGIAFTGYYVFNPFVCKSQKPARETIQQKTVRSESSQ